MSTLMDSIKNLREQTGAGFLDCKKALEESKGDIDKAKDIIKKKGQSIMDKKSARDASEGVVDSYIHSNNKIGAMVELNCETDFVARNEEFKKLAHDIAMQVTASNPKVVNPEDLKDSDIAEEKQKIEEEANNEGKPADIAEKIVAGKLAKLKNDLSLIKQPLIKDTDKTIEDLLTEATAKLGEKIVIKRFVRYEIN